MNADCEDGKKGVDEQGRRSLSHAPFLEDSRAG
jgi:hypothetical protein